MKRVLFVLASLVIVIVGVVVTGLFLWNLGAGQKVVQQDLVTARDPKTGIIAGAQPRDCGSENACGAVLFIHGFGGSANHFEQLPQRVAEAGWHARVMLLPGHGTCPAEFGGTSSERMLDAVLDEARQLLNTHEKVILLGHSMGGALATIAAAQLPETAGLILGAPYYAITPRWYYIFAPETWMRHGPSLVQWVHVNPARQPVFRREISREIIAYRWFPTKAAIPAMNIAARASDSATLAIVKQPVLLIHGRKDEVTWPDAAVRAVNGMASTSKRTVLLDNSNHMLFWDYERETVAQEVLAFLKARL